MSNKILLLNVEDWTHLFVNTDLYMKFKKIANEISYDPFIPSGTAILIDGKKVTKIVMKKAWN